MNRTNQTRIIRLTPKAFSLRQEIVNMIHAHNNILNRYNMRGWDWWRLLTNVHPLYRKAYAVKLVTAELMSVFEFESLTGIPWTKRSY